jgi:hypothetical protein
MLEKTATGRHFLHFEKELTPDQRKAAIKQLQAETAGKP